MGETIGEGNTRRVLETTDRNRKRMQFRNHLSRRTINIQIHDSDYRQEVTGQANERKDPRDEKTIEMIKQNTYEKTKIQYPKH